MAGKAPTELLLTTGQLAEAVGLSLPALRQTWLRHVPHDGKVMDGKFVKYRLKAVAAIVAEMRRREQSRPEQDDPMFAGADSPQLERYRAAKASLAELELERQRGTVLDRAMVSAAMSAAVRPLVDAVDHMQRIAGPEIVEVYNEAVQQFAARWDEVIRERAGDAGQGDGGTGLLGGPDEPDGGEAASDAPAVRGAGVGVAKRSACRDEVQG